MSKKPNRRKRIFVDPKVQGALVSRAMLYWVACLITIGLMLFCWQVLTHPGGMFFSHLELLWLDYAPALVASLLILPLLALDIVRMSNRFVGPLLRLRSGMRALARGEAVEPIRFRKGDFWRGFAEEFNVVAECLQAQSQTPDYAEPAAEAEVKETADAVAVC